MNPLLKHPTFQNGTAQPSMLHCLAQTQDSPFVFLNLGLSGKKAQ